MRPVPPAAPVPDPAPDDTLTAHLARIDAQLATLAARPTISTTGAFLVRLLVLAFWLALLPLGVQVLFYGTLVVASLFRAY